MLQFIEDTMGLPVRNLFDLIVGTSTGGIIALALTAAEPKPLTAKEGIDLFKRLSSKELLISLSPLFVLLFL